MGPFCAVGKQKFAYRKHRFASVKRESGNVYIINGKKYVK